MTKIFDPSQETFEEYLRRIHLEYKLSNRVEIDDKGEAQEAKNKCST